MELEIYMGLIFGLVLAVVIGCIYWCLREIKQLDNHSKKG